MAHTTTYRGAGYGVRACDSCGSEHLGPDCGLTYAQRLRSVRLDGSVTESRSKARYWDEEPLGDLFQDGLTGKERSELVMDETNGVGYVDNPKDMTPTQEKEFSRAFGFDEV